MQWRLFTDQHSYENADSFMPLRRASSQRSTTLEGFYQELALSADSVTSSIGAQMLSLLPMLTEVCVPFNLWGLASLAHLWLLAADDWRSPWLVCITPIPSEGYRIQYKTVEGDAPRPEARVEGVASDETTCVSLNS